MAGDYDLTEQAILNKVFNEETNTLKTSSTGSAPSAVDVNNFPSEYPLPAAQVSTLTPPAAITGFATSAKQLADNHQVSVSNIASTPVIAGFATSAKQDSQITLGTQLETLVDTLQELIQRLAPLAGAMSNAASLRVSAGTTTIPVSGTVTASGPITSAQSIAEKNVAGVSYTQRVAQENLTATLANINNAVAA